MTDSSSTSTLLRATGHLLPSQARSFICLPFHVPSDAGELRIRFTFQPARVGNYKNLLTLSLFDPHGFRGAGHRHAPEQEVVVGRYGATPGFLPGAVPPGQWLLEIDCHAVLQSPNGGVAYSVAVEVCSADRGDAGPEPRSSRPLVGPQTTDDRRQTTAPVPVVGRPSSVVAGAAVAGTDDLTGALGHQDPPPRWLKGDLHLHSQHSDGRWSMDDLARYVERNALDFVAVADHNTTAAGAAIEGLLRKAGLPTIVIPAMELTTFYGHANALGVPQWIDWRVGGPEAAPPGGIHDASDALSPERPSRSQCEGVTDDRPPPTVPSSVVGRRSSVVKPSHSLTAPLAHAPHPARTMADAAAEVHHLGGTFVINHPRSSGYPACTGCRWEFGAESAQYADALEVWNGAWDRPQNHAALGVWNRWLNTGRRIPATAGTDSHLSPTKPEAQGYTHVWASPAAGAILEAVRAGRSFLSCGPQLTWRARPDAGRLGNAPHRPEVQVAGLAAPADLCLVRNGRTVARRLVSGDDTVTLDLPAGSRRGGWYRAELYRPGTANLLALTNPVYAG